MKLTKKILTVFLTVLLLLNTSMLHMINAEEDETAVNDEEIEEVLEEQEETVIETESENNEESVEELTDSLVIENEETDETVLEEPEITETIKEYDVNDMSGSFGDGLTWKLDPNGTLTISGTGEMLEGEDVPWWDYSLSITSLVIEEGMSSISDNEFGYMYNLKSVSIPNTVTSIESYAFAYCESLPYLEIPDSVSYIGHGAFEHCDSLRTIFIPSSLKAAGEEGTLFGGCPEDLIIYTDASENNGDWYHDWNCDWDNNCHQTKYNTSRTQFNLLLNKDYSVYYRLNGGVNNSKNPAKHKATDDSIVLMEPTRKGYDFAGWYLEDTFENEVKIIGSGISKDITLYAKWVEVTELASGTIGKTVDWSLSTGGTLTIAPNGVSGDCVLYYKSFDEYRDDIKRVVIENGITEIYSAFYSCTSLVSISIPNSVEVIEGSFDGCSSLTSITIPSGVTYIGEDSFSGCYSLTSINVSSNNSTYKSENGVLFSKDGNEILQYPLGKKDECYIIPNGVKTIGKQAFTGNSSLVSIVIPQSVTEIKENALTYCERLANLYIPSSVTILEDYMLVGSHKELTIYTDLPSDLPGWSENWNAEWDDTKYNVEYNTPFDEYMLIVDPDFGYSITYVLDGGTNNPANPSSFLETSKDITLLNPRKTGYSFEGWYSDASFRNKVLKIASGTNKNVTLYAKWKELQIVDSGECGDDLIWMLDRNNTLTISGSGDMYDYSLYGDSPWISYAGTIKKVVIESGVTSIGVDAFYRMNGITTVELPDTIVSIGISAFPITSIETVKIPSLEKWLEINFGNNNSNPLCYDANLFIDNKPVEKLIIPEGTTEIKDFAFYSGNFTDISFPNSLKRIGKNAFSDCYYIKPLMLPDGLEYIDEYAFGSESKYIYIPKSVKTIKKGAFGRSVAVFVEENEENTNFDPQWNSSYGNCAGAFYGVDKNVFEFYSSLDEKATELVIPEGITFIPDCAFIEMNYLEKITIPDSVTYIGSKVFESYRLKTLFIPGTVEVVEGGNYERSPFSYVSDNLTVYIEAEEIPDDWGYYWNYIERDRTVEYVLGSTREIADFFNNLTGKERDVVVPEGVIAIPERQFEFNDYLSTIILPKTLRRIGDATFIGASNLKEIAIPDGVESIGHQAFDYCDSLKKVFIPASVEYMSSSVFRDDYEFLKIFVEAEYEPSGWDDEWNYYSYTLCNSKGCTPVEGSYEVVYGSTYEDYLNYNPSYYSIRYNLGIEDAINPISNQSELDRPGQSFTLSPAIRNGYTFLGWYDNPNFSGTSIKTVTAPKKPGGIELYAKWKENSYTLKYDANGGRMTSVAQKKYTTSQEVVITEVIPSKPGYDFCGWTTVKNNDSVIYDSECSYTSLNEGIKDGATIILYALWEPVYAESITINGPMEVMAGASVIYGVNVYPNNAIVNDILWTSADTSIATISKGKLAVNKNISERKTVEITAQSISQPELCNTFTVTICPAVKKVVILDEPVIGFEMGEEHEYWLSADTEPLDSGKGIKWTSSNKLVTVDEDGTVHIPDTFTKPTTVKITATATDGSRKSAYVSLYIGKLVQNIEITGPTEVAVKKTITLKAITDPLKPSKTKLNWTSSDKSIATVSNGKVKGVSEGDVVITAEATDGSGIYAEYYVSVKPAVTQVNIYDYYTGNLLTKTSTIGCELGEECEWKLYADTNPEGASQSITWSSSNKNVTVDENGTVYVPDTFIKPITVKITATAMDGTKKSASVSLYIGVLVKDIDVIGPEEISVGQTVTLNVITEPLKPSNSKMTWTTSDKNVATVTNGKVKGISEGTVTIYVEPKDGSGICAEYVLTVKPKQ